MFGRLHASRNASRRLPQDRRVQGPSSPFPASTAQGGEAGGLGFLAALGVGRLDRGRLLVRLGLGEGAGANELVRDSGWASVVHGRLDGSSCVVG